MLIERIEIVAFGPFENRQLDLAPGMTVLFGPNEAGKSTWHAAIYLAMCGLPRGRGRPTKDVERLIELHKPWDGQTWEARATLRLADGRQIEIHQDLAGRVDCRAIDLTTGRDVSNEIVDGTLDASRWLGLDRRSFLATACVRQADLLAVLQDPDSLQEHLQRAAATAGTDATAAAAIQRVDDFKSDNVGLDRVNSTKPLRRARQAVEEADSSLRLAREEHQRFTDDSARAERAVKKAEELEREARAARARLARQELGAATAKLRRINQLRSELGDDRPPDASAGRRELDKARAALQEWEQRPNEVSVEGEAAAELEARLQALPAMPTHDLAVERPVGEAWHAYELARDALTRQPALPPPPPPPHTGGLDREELYEAIRVLDQDEPAVPQEVERHVEVARSRVQDASRPASFLPLIAAGAIALVVGTVLAVAGVVAVGIIVLLGGASLIVASLVLRGQRRTAALESLSAAESELGEQRFALDRIRKEKQATRARLTDAGLPHRSDELRQLLTRLGQAATDAATRTSRAMELEQLRGELASAGRALADALEARGVDVDQGGIESAYRSYVEACERNAEVAAKARERGTLEGLLAQRQGLERTAAEAEQKRSAAREKLRAVAAANDVEGPDELALADGLSRWIDQRERELAVTERAVKGWSELDGLLEGKTVDDTEAEVRRLEASWGALSAGIDETALSATRNEDGNLPALVDWLDHEASKARSEADRLGGQIHQIASRLPSVAEAEERFAAAEGELGRVRRLDETLSLTLGFLREAQDRVHRDIAPKLAGTIRAWLPAITDGRYVDAAVDPASLAVRVRTAEAAWRDARLLSQGTREQVYLLLRVALAEHLVTGDEVSPLILDDVTVQCDTTRTQRILEILHEVSQEGQVILFTQEDDVQRWAERRLEVSRDKLILLD